MKSMVRVHIVLHLFCGFFPASTKDEVLFRSYQLQAQWFLNNGTDGDEYEIENR